METSEKDLRLLIIEDGINSNTIALKKGRNYVIGRKEKCEIYINDKLISKKHGEIMISNEGKIKIKDYSSTNGTYLDGIKLNSESGFVELSENSEVSFGTCKTRLRILRKELEKTENKKTKEKEKKNLANKSCSVSRSRSRSREKELKSPEKPQEKEKSFIKSELIWKNSNFENTKKKLKFLRLLGAKDVTSLDDIKNQEIESKTKATNDKINKDLEKQFNISLNRKDKGRSGLGL